jgi:hypothetical protein
LPLRADALCAATMSMGHKAGAMNATYGQGKERRLWQK